MQRFTIHPDNPQARVIRQVAEQVQRGEVIAYPTDTSYALGCEVGNKAAIEQIARLRQLDERHQYTLLCRDLSEIATYARVDNAVYRLLKAHTPSRCTFILEATNEVPRRLAHPKKKTIGIRIPTDAFCQQLLAELGAPLVTTTLQLPGDDQPLDDPDEISLRIGKSIPILVDSGILTTTVTTVIDLTTGQPQLIREGAESVADWW